MNHVNVNPSKHGTSESKSISTGQCWKMCANGKSDYFKGQFNSTVKSTPPGRNSEPKKHKDTTDAKRSFVVCPSVFNHPHTQKKKPDQTYSVGKRYKKTLRDDKGPQKEKLAQRAGKKCFIIIVIITKTKTGRETLSETKSLLGAPQHCNVPDNNKKVSTQFFPALQHSRKHEEAELNGSMDFPGWAAPASIPNLRPTA